MRERYIIVNRKTIAIFVLLECGFLFLFFMFMDIFYFMPKVYEFLPKIPEDKQVVEKQRPSESSDIFEYGPV